MNWKIGIRQSGVPAALGAALLFGAGTTWIASVKGLVSGAVNLMLAFALGASFPALTNLAGAMLVGLLAYGVSLTLFVTALRHLGSARTGAYFSVAPFFGALLALLMGDSVSIQIIIAGILMALGTWLHLTERHEHVAAQPLGRNRPLRSLPCV